MDKDAFLIEQYKLVRERSNKHEEVQFQMLVLNITAFAAIFGLGGLLNTPLIPFALLSVLIICARTSLGARSLGRQGTAFLIEKYGTIFKGDTYESGYSTIIVTVSERRSFFRRIGRFLVSIFLEPFMMLTIISLFGGVFASYKYWVELWGKSGFNFVIVLIALVIDIMGHLLVIYSIFINRKLTLSHYRKLWKNYIETINIQ